MPLQPDIRAQAQAHVNWRNASILRAIFSWPFRLLAALGIYLRFARPSRSIWYSPTAPAKLKIAQADESVSYTDWVEENVPSLAKGFKASWWLPNGHFQTLFNVFGNFKRVDEVRYERYVSLYPFRSTTMTIMTHMRTIEYADSLRTLLRVPDGGTISLDLAPNDHQQLPDGVPIVVVCHGLTGGSHESYVRSVITWAIRPAREGGLGGRGVVLNFRGCAGTPLTSPQFYGPGSTVDLHTTLHYLRSLYPTSTIHGVGFSLGSSILASYLAETGFESLLSSGIILGCPWDLAVTSQTVSQGWFNPRVYSNTLGMNLINKTCKLMKQYPGILDGEDSVVRDKVDVYLKLQKKGAKTRMPEVDKVLVSQVGGSTGVGTWPWERLDEFYKWASAQRTIAGVRVPTLVVHANDDPVFPGSALPITQLQSSPSIYTALTPTGGHLGWFSGPFPLWSSHRQSKARWIIEPISEFVSAAARDLPSRNRVLAVTLTENEVGPSLSTSSEREQVERQSRHDGTDRWQWAKIISGDDGRELNPKKYEGMGRHDVGWRVISVGESVRGEEGSGTLQGL